MFFIGKYYTKGVSGEKYELFNFPIPYEHPILFEWEGVYIFAKEDGEFILVGSGNVRTETDRLIKEGGVMEGGASIILIHLENNPDNRKYKEIDIIKGNPECFGEDGLNNKP